MPCRAEGRAPSGAPGPSGAAAPNGQDGPAGEAHEPEIACITVTEIAREMSLVQLLMVLHRAEVAYLNEDYRRCVSDFAWLERIARARVEADPSAAPTGEWEALQRRAAVLGAQLAAGLDFYGLPHNHAPRVALEIYKRDVDALGKIAKTVEESYENYQGAYDDKKGQRERLRDALNQSARVLQSLESERKVAEEAARKAQEVVAQLTTSLQAQEGALFGANSALQAAIQRQAGCEFGEVLKALGTIVAVGRAAYGDISGIVGVVAAVGAQDAGTTSVDGVIEQVRKVAGNVDDLREQYGKIRGLVQERPHAAKVIMEREEFDRVMAPYRDLPEARAYQAQLDAYLATLDTINHTLLDAHASRVRAEALAAEIAQRQLEEGRIRNGLTAQYDPALAECVAFFGRLYRQVREMICRALHREFRAYQYWALVEGRFQVDDRSVAALLATQADLITQWENALERFKRPASVIQGLTVVLSEEDFAPEFARLREGKPLTFSIPPSHDAFRELAAVFVQDVVIRIPGATTGDGRLYARLVHQGRSRIVTPAREPRDYLHEPVATLVINNLRDDRPMKQGLGGQEGVFASLSPFALWTLDLSANRGLDLSAARSIELEFSASFLPFN